MACIAAFLVVSVGGGVFIFLYSLLKGYPFIRSAQGDYSLVVRNAKGMMNLTVGIFMTTLLILFFICLADWSSTTKENIVKAVLVTSGVLIVNLHPLARLIDVNVNYFYYNLYQPRWTKRHFFNVEWWDRISVLPTLVGSSFLITAGVLEAVLEA